MKQLLFIAAICLLFLTACSKRETVILQPEFDLSNCDNYLAFSKIELADTATILSVDAYNLPNKAVSVSSKSVLKGSSGKIYKLRRACGFDLDREVFMPESGNISFTLVFEPLDKNEKTVDYYNTIDDKNAFFIEGLKLYDVKHVEPIWCRLQGEVIDCPKSSRLMLSKWREDVMVKRLIYIPIRDGKFDYMLYTDSEEAWELILGEEIKAGVQNPIYFIAEQGTVRFTLNDAKNRQNNTIAGGKHNTEYQDISKKISEYVQPYYRALNEKQDSLTAENKFYSPEFMSIVKKLEKLPQEDPKRNELYDQMTRLWKEGRDLTPEARSVNEESNNLSKMQKSKELEYIREHVDIASYTLLTENIRTGLSYRRIPGFPEYDLNPMLSVFHDFYEKAFPLHPYTSMIKLFVEANEIKKGFPCPEVSFEDSNGKKVSLSEQIKGKVALVHLWASWCMPCRRHGIEMIEVYEKYRDKGFTVVGIAREKVGKDVLKPLEKDKYPWNNYLELNDKNGIWAKFGIGNSGGGEFLVDAEGNFLAVNTDTEEIKKILSEIFN